MSLLYTIDYIVLILWLVPVLVVIGLYARSLRQSRTTRMHSATRASSMGKKHGRREQESIDL